MTRKKVLHNIREDLEDKLADILAKIDNNESVDDAEKQLIITGMKSLASQFGGANIPDKAYNFCAEEIVKCLEKLNKKIQIQLRKR